MGDIVQFPAAVGEHPALRGLRERMGRLSAEESAALETLRKSLLEDGERQYPLADEIRKKLSEPMTPERLKGWMVGLAIGKRIAHELLE